MKVLVTGSTGFTGRRVARGLAEAGHALRCLVRPGSDRSAIEGVPAELAPGDLADPATVRAAAEGCEALMYVASMGFGHVAGVVEACRSGGIRRAVFFSTTAVLTTLPSRSRAIRLGAEETVRDSRLAYTILRPTMIYGAPGDRNVERLVRAAARFPALPVTGDGGNKVQPVFVDDLAMVAVRALSSEAAVGRVYQVPGRRPLTMRELVVEAMRAVGRRPRVIRIPASLCLLGARLAEVLLRRPPVRVEQVARLLEDKDFDWSEASRDLAYDPIDPREGLRTLARRIGLREEP